MSEVAEIVDTIIEDAAEETEVVETEFDWDSEPEDFPSEPLDVDSEETPEAEAKPVEEEKEEEETEEADKKDGEEVAFDISTASDDTIISVKVDGELQNISLKDYKNGISGEKAIAKRFTESDKANKQLQSEVNEINAYVNEFAAKLQSGQSVAALQYLSQFSNIPSYEVTDMLIKELMPEIERREGVSFDQLNLEKSQAKLKFDTEKSEEATAKQSHEQAVQGTQLLVDKAMQTHSIDQEAWDEAFQYLDTNLPASDALTVDTVKEYVLFSRAEEAFAAVDSNLETDNATMNTFINIQAENPDFTQEDLITIIKESYGKVTEEKVEEKLETVTQKKQVVKTAAKTKKSEPIEFEPLDSDDWDDIL
jgi:hypothetical protein